jgi:hypothetical protein
MSTDYRPIPAIPFNQLFDGRLDKYGVREKADPDTTVRRRYLVGGDGVLEAYKNDDGTSSFSRRSFTPVPWAVIDALTEEFETELVSEHDHRFWGFATKEEERDWHDQMAKEAEDNFYKDLSHYLRGEARDARIAKRPVRKVLPAHRDEPEDWLASRPLLRRGRVQDRRPIRRRLRGETANAG